MLSHMVDPDVLLQLFSTWSHVESSLEPTFVSGPIWPQLLSASTFSNGDLCQVLCHLKFWTVRSSKNGGGVPPNRPLVEPSLSNAATGLSRGHASAASDWPEKFGTRTSTGAWRDTGLSWIISSRKTFRPLLPPTTLSTFRHVSCSSLKSLSSV